MNNNFQVAISFSDEKTWLAEDLYNLLTEQGVKTFYYKADPDFTSGKLETKIIDIYENSSINVIIWSDEYSKKSYDSIVNTELKTMERRHINNQEFESLLIINSDNSMIHNKFSEITYHNIETFGIFKTRNSIIKRLTNLYVTSESNNPYKIYHPYAEQFKRGRLSLCKFKLNQDFKNDEQKNWNKYGDLLITLIENSRKIERGIFTYLIPSGRVTNLLSHTNILRTQEHNLKIKKDLSERFYSENKNKELIGFIFFRYKEDVEYPYVYCLDYDNYLNEGLHTKTKNSFC